MGKYCGAWLMVVKNVIGGGGWFCGAWLEGVKVVMEVLAGS